MLFQYAKKSFYNDIIKMIDNPADLKAEGYIENNFETSKNKIKQYFEQGIVLRIKIKSQPQHIGFVAIEYLPNNDCGFHLYLKKNFRYLGLIAFRKIVNFCKLSKFKTMFTLADKHNQKILDRLKLMKPYRQYNETFKLYKLELN